MDDFEAGAKAARAAMLRGASTEEIHTQVAKAMQDAWTAQARMISAIKRKAKSVVSAGSQGEQKKSVKGAPSSVSSEHVAGRNPRSAHVEPGGEPKKFIKIGWAQTSSKKKKKKKKKPEEKKEEEQ
jgi:hypothetical protein